MVLVYYGDSSDVVFKFRLLIQCVWLIKCHSGLVVVTDILKRDLDISADPTIVQFNLLGHFNGSFTVTDNANEID